MQLGEVGEVSEFGWYRSSEIVVIEGQQREVGEVSEFGWYRSSETVVSDAQAYEFGEVSQFGRQRAVQPPTKNEGYQFDALRGSS